jgi:threonylcarbamoyladenosine tRNA methylthiotransferase MtaB
MGVDIVTFGCRLNTFESEVMRAHAAAARLDDTVIVNTCAVTAEAVRQARQSIRRLKREKPNRRIVVTGCAAQTEPHTFANMPEVDRVLGNGSKLDASTWTDAASALSPTACGGSESKLHVQDIMRAHSAAAPLVDGFEGRARAFVQVQTGCDHRCTFCIIPFGRGNSRSTPMSDVVAQVRRLTERGYREVVLTGVDITSYGHDLPDAPRLGTLVKRILRAVPELERLRLSSIDSVEADADLFDAIGTEPRLMPHLHLSLQAGDDLVLKRMKRRHSRSDAIRFCQQVRSLRPDMVFGADLIAGFPTENEEMFNRSVDLIDECGLTQLHVFLFSPRPGTPAARMPQVPRDVAKDRARRLREKGDAVYRAHLAREVGAARNVLVEQSGVGRTEHFLPARLVSEVAAGNIVTLRIARHDERYLIAS